MGIFAGLMDFLYPPRCPKCKAYVEERGGWCLPCLRQAVHVRRLHLPPELAGSMERVWALGYYRGELQDLIRGLKYQGKKGNLSYIETFLRACEGELDDLPSGTVAVPVPLHPARERERGFNQVELIFHSWLAGRGVPMEPILLRRRRTKAQYGLSVRERRENLRDAFALAEGVDVRGRDILLLDDVLTTGATFWACSAALKAAGALAVCGLALASDRT